MTNTTYNGFLRALVKEEQEEFQEAEVVETKPLERPDTYISKQTTTIEDEVLGLIQITANWPLERIIDDPQYFSDGFCLIDERHLIARPDLFEPQYKTKKLK